MRDSAWRPRLIGASLMGLLLLAFPAFGNPKPLAELNAHARDMAEELRKQDKPWLLGYMDTLEGLLLPETREPTLSDLGDGERLLALAVALQVYREKQPEAQGLYRLEAKVAYSLFLLGESYEKNLNFQAQVKHMFEMQPEVAWLALIPSFDDYGQAWFEAAFEAYAGSSAEAQYASFYQRQGRIFYERGRYDKAVEAYKIGMKGPVAPWDVRYLCLSLSKAEPESFMNDMRSLEEEYREAGESALVSELELCFEEVKRESLIQDFEERVDFTQPEKNVAYLQALQKSGNIKKQFHVLYHFPEVYLEDLTLFQLGNAMLFRDDEEGLSQLLELAKRQGGMDKSIGKILAFKEWLAIFQGPLPALKDIDAILLKFRADDYPLPKDFQEMAKIMAYQRAWFFGDKETAALAKRKLALAAHALVGKGPKEPELLKLALGIAVQLKDEKLIKTVGKRKLQAVTDQALYADLYASYLESLMVLYAKTHQLRALKEGLSLLEKFTTSPEMGFLSDQRQAALTLMIEVGELWVLLSDKKSGKSRIDERPEPRKISTTDAYGEALMQARQLNLGTAFYLANDLKAAMKFWVSAEGMGDEPWRTLSRAWAHFSARSFVKAAELCGSLNFPEPDESLRFYAMACVAEASKGKDVSALWQSVLDHKTLLGLPKKKDESPLPIRLAAHPFFNALVLPGKDGNYELSLEYRPFLMLLPEFIPSVNEIERRARP